MKLRNRNYLQDDYEKYIQPLVKENMQQLFIENFGGWSDAVSKNKFFETLKIGSIQLFFKEETFVGYVSYEEEKNNSQSILINNIHIQKKFQQEGYGTQILNWVESQITKYNQIKIFVFKNNTSKKFYEKNNFKEISELSKSHTSVMIKEI